MLELERCKARLGWILLLIVPWLTFAAPPTEASRKEEVQEHLQKAFSYLKVIDLDSAVGEFQSVLLLDLKNAESYANLGVIAFARGDYKKAVSNLGNALSIDPSLVKTQALLGIAERRLGDPSALASLQKSFPLLKDKSLRIQTGLELASLYYSQGSLDGAASLMRELVDLDPDNAEILYMAQRVYYELADGTLNKLAIIAPESDRMQEVIAERLVNQGNLKGATEHYKKASNINPHLPGIHYELAEAILESAPNDPQIQQQAEAELNAAIKYDGDSAGTECMFARIASRRSDPDAVLAHYKRALELSPGNSEAQIGIGHLLASKGKPEEGIKYIREAVASDPLNERAHYFLATLAKRLEINDEAEREFTLFRKIQQMKAQLRELYKQMNVSLPGRKDDDQEPNPK